MKLKKTTENDISNSVEKEKPAGASFMCMVQQLVEHYNKPIIKSG